MIPNGTLEIKFFIKPALCRESEGVFKFRSKDYKFTDEHGRTFSGSLQDTETVKSFWFEDGFVRKFNNGTNSFTYQYKIVQTELSEDK